MTTCDAQVRLSRRCSIFAKPRMLRPLISRTGIARSWRKQIPILRVPAREASNLGLCPRDRELLIRSQHDERYPDDHENRHTNQFSMRNHVPQCLSAPYSGVSKARPLDEG